MNKSFFQSHLDTFLKLLVFVIFFALGMDQAKAETSTEIKSAFDIMTLEDSYECKDKCPHHSFADAVQFKAWTAKEREIVGAYLKNINDPRLAFFLKKIQEKGITKIHRVQYGANWWNNSSARRAEFSRSTGALLWVNPVTHVIGFTDEFFTGTPFIDPYAQIERRQLNILHELAHVFDVALDHISSKNDFYQASGWNWNGKDWEIKGVGLEKVTQNFDSVLKLVKQNKTPQAYAHDRELGRSLAFPTAYAMTNSHESFAEFVAYFIFDPTAETYMSPQMIQYLHKTLQGK